MRVKLTTRLIKSIEPTGERIVLHDTEIRGLQCRISAAGKKVFYLYYRTEDGQERRPALGEFGTASLEKFRKKAQHWLGIVADGGDPSASRNFSRKSLTMKELTDQYIADHAKPNKKLSSVKSDQSLIDNHILPRFQYRKVASITRADVFQMHNEMRETPGAANRTIALMSKMMNLAERWELRSDGTNPTRHVEKYKERKLERFLSLDEIQRLWKALDDTERLQLEHGSVVPAIRLLALTGCRLGEILSLEWSMVDIENRHLRLKDSKTGAKTIHLSEMAANILTTLQNVGKTPFAIYGRHDGKRLIGISRPWYRIRACAELSDLRIHDLRHTFASIGVSAGLSLPVIGKLLGHTQTQTTARYAHLYDDPLKQGAELVSAAIVAATQVADDKGRADTQEALVTNHA